MNEDDKTLLIETSERAKSNTHQIEEIKADIKEVKEDQKAIYELTSSVRVIAENVSNMKEDISDIKNKQNDANDKIDRLEKTPYQEYQKTKHDIKVNVISKILSGIGLSLISILITLIATGKISL